MSIPKLIEIAGHCDEATNPARKVGAAFTVAHVYVTAEERDGDCVGVCMTEWRNLDAVDAKSLVDIACMQLQQNLDAMDD